MERILHRPASPGIAGRMMGPLFSVIRFVYAS